MLPDSPPQQQDASGSQKLHVDRLGLNFARARTQPRRFHLLNSRTLTKSPPGSGKFVGHTERGKKHHKSTFFMHAASSCLSQGRRGRLCRVRAPIFFFFSVSPADKSWSLKLTSSIHFPITTYPALRVVAKLTSFKSEQHLPASSAPPLLHLKTAPADKSSAKNLRR